MHTAIALLTTILFASISVTNASDATHQQHSIAHLAAAAARVAHAASAKKAKVFSGTPLKQEPQDYEYLPQIPIPAVRNLIGEYIRYPDGLHQAACYSVYALRWTVVHNHWPTDATMLTNGTFTLKPGEWLIEQWLHIHTHNRDLPIRLRNIPGVPFYDGNDEYEPAIKYTYNTDTHTGQVLLNKKNGKDRETLCFGPYKPDGADRVDNFLKLTGFMFESTDKQ